MLRKLISELNELFGIDLRSLAIFRMGLGLLILTELFMRSSDIRAFYTDVGSMPRSFLFEKVANMWYVSLHAANGTEAFQIFLFCVSAVCAIALLVGYRTRFFTILSWFLLISIQNRNPMILNSGSIYFRMLLFWGMFLPLGAVWSVDSVLKRPAEKKPVRVLSVASLALLLQVIIVYWFSVSYKYQPEWRIDGTAIYYALHVDQMTKPFGHFLLNFPGLLRWMTFGTYWFEIFGPLLLLAPFLLFLPLGRIRTIMVAVFILFHFGLHLSFEMGLFAWICMAALLPFLPTWFWEKTLGFLGRRKSEAEPEVFPERSGLLSIAPNAMAAFFLAYIFIWNLSGVVSSVAVPRSLRFIGPLFRVDQLWEMFRFAIKDDGWYVIPGKLRNGTEVDVFRKRTPVNWDKPANTSQMYKNEFWQKYMMNLASSRVDPDFRMNFAKSLCREWNTDHTEDGEKLETFDIYFMMERTLENNQTASLEKLHLWKHYCFHVPRA